MNLSESLLQPISNVAMDGATNAASPVGGRSSADADSFATALAAAAANGAAPGGRGTTPSIPVGRTPGFRGPHPTKIPIAPEAPDSPWSGLLASAAAGVAALTPNSIAPQPTQAAGDLLVVRPPAGSGSASSLGATEREISSVADSAAKSVATTYRSIEDAISGLSNSIAPPSLSSTSAQPQPPTAAGSQNPFESGTPSLPRDAIGQIAGTVGSKLVDTVLESIPLVGNIVRLMQGSESHISPSAVAFAQSGPDAEMRDAASATTGSDEPQKSAAQAEQRDSVPAAESLAVAEAKTPVIVPPDLLAGLPQLHANTSAASTESAKNLSAAHAARDSQMLVANANGQGASAAQPQQTASDARSSLTERLAAEMQVELVPVKPELGGEGSSLGEQASANQNADTATTRAAQTPAVASATKNNDGPAGDASMVDSDAIAVQVPRAIIEGVATAAKEMAANGSGLAGASTANGGGFAQAVTAAAAGVGSAAQQTTLASTTATEARAFTQPSAPPAPQLPIANPIPANTNSEMRVAMQTDLLGSIDLRAAMHQSTLTATIGVQREDVQTLLANELPALQHALAEKNLQVGQISVLNNNTGGHAGGGFDSRSSGHDPRREPPSAQSAFTMPYVQAIGQGLGDEAAAMAADFYGGVTAGRVNVVV